MNDEVVLVLGSKFICSALDYSLCCSLVPSLRLSPHGRVEVELCQEGVCYTFGYTAVIVCLTAVSKILDVVKYLLLDPSIEEWSFLWLRIACVQLVNAERDLVLAVSSEIVEECTKHLDL